MPSKKVANNKQYQPVNLCISAHNPDKKVYKHIQTYTNIYNRNTNNKKCDDWDLNPNNNKLDAVWHAIIIH